MSFHQMIVCYHYATLYHIITHHRITVTDVILLGEAEEFDCASGVLAIHNGRHSSDVQVATRN